MTHREVKCYLSYCMTNKRATDWTKLPKGGKSQSAGSRPIVRRTLHGQVVDEIGTAIVRGELEPGTALPTEPEWSARLGVSRTALREASKVLAAKGLIESRPKTGTRVRPRDTWNFLDPKILTWRLEARRPHDYARDLFELRRVIEPAACALAAGRATREQLVTLDTAYRGMEKAGDDGELWVAPDLLFHQTILRMTGNELIGSLAALIGSALALSFRLSNDNPAGQSHSLPLHKDVLVQIRARDGEKARRAMTVLLDHSEEDVRDAIANRRTRRQRDTRSGQPRPPL